MTSIKHILLVPGALLALAVPAFAGDGDQGPFLMQAHPPALQRTVPGRDVGSEAYPATIGLGAANPSEFTNHVLRDRVPAYQRGFDVGAESYPEPR
jgi:hypothetical protein